MDCCSTSRPITKRLAQPENSLPFERRPLNPQQVRSRKTNFQFSAEIPKLWLRDNLIVTHFFNGINLFLPAFEAFMVRVMKAQLKNVDSAELKKQISGFIAQEATHSQAHEQYNQTLREQGYKFDAYLNTVDFVFSQILEKRLGAKVSLAVIAGFEHLTSGLAEIALRYDMLINGDYKMKALWEWHAAEEIEHKTLAFDFLQVIDNGYWLRSLGAVIGAAIVVSGIASGMLLLCVQEPNFFSIQSLVDLKKLLLTEYKLVPRSLSIFWQYFKPTFHPSQRSSDYLGERVFTAN